MVTNVGCCSQTGVWESSPQRGGDNRSLDWVSEQDEDEVWSVQGAWEVMEVKLYKWGSDPNIEHIQDNRRTLQIEKGG